MTKALMNLARKLRLWVKLFFTYVTTHKRLFITSALLGAAVIMFLPQAVLFLDRQTARVTGFSGNYTLATLPLPLQRELSLGLTQLTANGQATSGAALSWTQSNDNKKMVFTLDKNLFWQDGSRFDSSQVNYNLRGVIVNRISPYEIEFTLNESFAPLPVIVSQPLFKSGLVGLGEYKLENIRLNGRFISDLTLRSVTSGELKNYKFYPSEDTAATALKLGEVSTLSNMHRTFDFPSDPHYEIREQIDYSTIATLFFNNSNPLLEDKGIRQALTYALPNSFSQGERAYSPIATTNWSFNPSIKKYPQNLETAKKGLAKLASESGKTTLTISTVTSLEEVAKEIAKIWTDVGVPTEVQRSDILPINYDVYLAYMDIPVDPDQYALWHSTQKGNITNYNSPRVDRLLEDGRQAATEKERKDIYFNFQRAITEDVPATFLFFPRLYTITRK